MLKINKEAICSKTSDMKSPQGCSDYKNGFCTSSGSTCDACYGNSRGNVFPKLKKSQILEVAKFLEGSCPTTVDSARCESQDEGSKKCLSCWIRELGKEIVSDSIVVGSYIEGTEMFGHAPRKVKGWVAKVSTDGYWIVADDELKGNRGTLVNADLGDIILLSNDKPFPYGNLNF